MSSTFKYTPGRADKLSDDHNSSLPMRKYSQISMNALQCKNYLRHKQFLNDPNLLESSDNKQIEGDEEGKYDQNTNCVSTNFAADMSGQLIKNRLDVH